MKLSHKVVLLEGSQHLQEQIQSGLSNVALCMSERPDDGVHQCVRTAAIFEAGQRRRPAGARHGLTPSLPAGGRAPCAAVTTDRRRTRHQSPGWWHHRPVEGAEIQTGQTRPRAGCNATPTAQDARGRQQADKDVTIARYDTWLCRRAVHRRYHLHSVLRHELWLLTIDFRHWRCHQQPTDRRHLRSDCKPSCVKLEVFLQELWKYFR